MMSETTNYEGLTESEALSYAARDRLADKIAEHAWGSTVEAFKLHLLQSIMPAIEKQLVAKISEELYTQVKASLAYQHDFQEIRERIAAEIAPMLSKRIADSVTKTKVEISLTLGRT